MRTMNQIMNEVTKENIAIAKKRSIIYGILCAVILFVLWLPTLLLIAMFPAIGSIVGATYGCLLMVGTPWTMILAFNYSSTHDSLVYRKQLDRDHKMRMAKFK